MLAFDFGLRRVGIASGNLLTRTAAPLTTFDCGAVIPWPAIDAVVADYAPGRLVVGVPEGSASGTGVADRARRFASDLAARYGLPVETVDEALSSRAAESALRDARRSGARTRRVGKDAVDALAATLIAEQWINAQTRGGPGERESGGAERGHR